MSKYSINRSFIVMAAASLLALGACQTIDPFTGESKGSSTVKGVAIGAAGGAVGAYMDKQEADLRKEIAGTGVSVTRQGDNLILNMPSNITFRSGSADLNADFFKVLDGVALVLKRYNKTVVDIAGHTDSVGSDSSNQALSERRASAVSQYLNSKGITGARTITVGGGENYPVASNDTESGRAMNRRVELTLLPLQE